MPAALDGSGPIIMTGHTCTFCATSSHVALKIRSALNTRSTLPVLWTWDLTILGTAKSENAFRLFSSPICRTVHNFYFELFEGASSFLKCCASADTSLVLWSLDIVGQTKESKNCCRLCHESLTQKVFCQVQISMSDHTAAVGNRAFVSLCMWSLHMCLVLCCLFKLAWTVKFSLQEK